MRDKNDKQEVGEIGGDGGAAGAVDKDTAIRKAPQHPEDVRVFFRSKQDLSRSIVGHSRVPV